jgi:hypothetical protein
VEYTIDIPLKTPETARTKKSLDRSIFNTSCCERFKTWESQVAGFVKRTQRSEASLPLWTKPNSKRMLVSTKEFSGEETKPRRRQQ